MPEQNNRLALFPSTRLKSGVFPIECNTIKI